MTGRRSVRDPEGRMLGVEFNATLVRASVVDGGRVQRSLSETFEPGARPEAMLEAVVRVAKQLEPEPAALGLGVPAEIDSQGRCWGFSTLAGFEGVYIAEELAARLGCPVAIESDAACAALGEKLYGRGRELDDFMVVLLGERVAAGLVLRKELYLGRSGFVAELGHLRIDSSEAAAQCVCSRRGCVAAYASDAALLAAFREQGGQTESAAALSGQADRGSELAQRCLAARAAALGDGIALVQNLLDLDAVAIVCSGANEFRWLEPNLRKHLRAQVFGAPASELGVYASTLAGDAVSIGAAELARSVRSA